MSMHNNHHTWQKLDALSHLEVDEHLRPIPDVLALLPLGCNE